MNETCIKENFYNLSEDEQRIILIISSKIKSTDEQNKKYNFGVFDFMDLLEITDEDRFSVISRIMNSFMNKTFEIKKDDKIILTPWLSSVDYEENTDQINLVISPKLKPYMLKLSDMFV